MKNTDVVKISSNCTFGENFKVTVFGSTYRTVGENKTDSFLCILFKLNVAGLRDLSVYLISIDQKYLHTCINQFRLFLFIYLIRYVLISCLLIVVLLYLICFIYFIYI